MPTNLKLKFTPEAKADLLEIFAYIDKQLSAPVAAVHLIDQIEHACKRLTAHPLSCPIPQDDLLAKKGYRMLCVGNFIAFYTADQHQVKIMRVIYGRRNYRHLL